MEFAEKTLDSKLIFDGRVVKLYKDSVELPTGQTSFREVIKHSGGVVILAYKEDKILLVKQFRYPMKEVLYELPAGKLEEETGYCAKNWTDLGFVYTSPGYSDEKLYLYKAEDLEFTYRHPDEGEILEPLEINAKEVLNMINDGRIRDAKTLCAIMKAEIKG